MAGSAQYTAGASTAVLVAAAPVSQTPGPVGWFYFANGSGSIVVYLGGPGVTASNGAAVAANGTFSGYLFSGDQIYAIAASSTAAVSVLQTGA